MADEAGTKLSGKGGAQATVETLVEHNVVAEDIFRRMSGLGGFLVVALVTPVPSRNGVGLRNQLFNATRNRLAAANQQTGSRKQARKSTRPRYPRNRPKR
jgi:hypothetical protein